MILYLDHHDSFSHIFCDYCKQLGFSIELIKTDDERLFDFDLTPYSHIIIGAGFGHPEHEALNGVRVVLKETLQSINPIPVLGVCLGHQLIASFLGAEITLSRTIMHGRLSNINCDNQQILFSQLPTQFKVCRYHSLQVAAESLPDCLQVIAETQSGEVMAIKHTTRPVWGIQYHPEAYLTEYGIETLANFLNFS